ncbi:MAG: hypothetical protein R3E58_07830 [Phycisphaerae bacterium]
MGQNERDFADWLAARCRRLEGADGSGSIPIGDDMGDCGQFQSDPGLVRSDARRGPFRFLEAQFRDDRAESRRL